VRIGSVPKKLIEFGWDEPAAAFLRKHQQAIERTPLDGCVFHKQARQGRCRDD
jgi:hypothetical protein